MSESSPFWNVCSLCTLSPWALSSQDFQKNPQPIQLGRQRLDNARLFRLLDQEENPCKRGELFHGYTTVQFALHQWSEFSSRARSSLRNSYVRFLRGWSMDSNSMEAAVLKGWVHSRFGLPPTFHHEPLEAGQSSWTRYETERIRGHAHTNAIHLQLDLLYEFCQYELTRRFPGERWIRLFRGTYDVKNYEVLEVLSQKQEVVRLNNLSSFTKNSEFAWEFGSTVWRVEIPLPKIFFFSDLLPQSILRGEDEFLVIGGEYRVEKVLF